MAASVCFPNGIKLCYEQNENNIKTVPNYTTYYTSGVGDKFFAVTYHFFLKMENKEFQNNYFMSSLRSQILTYQENKSKEIKKENGKDIKKKLDYFNQFQSRSNVYIPFCLCLISKFPFFEEIEKSLQSIFLSIKYNTTPEKLYNLVRFIVKSIPLPPLKTQISFNLPYINIPFKIQNPYLKDRLEFGDDPIFILKKLSIENIFCLFHLLILEQKILVIGKENHSISKFITNFNSLLYPFNWVHISIPILSEKMIKILKTYLPFFNGINKELLKIKDKDIVSLENVFFVDIDENTIFSYRKSKKIDSKKINNKIQKEFGKFPVNIKNFFEDELKEIIEAFNNTPDNNNNNNKKNFNIRIKNLFLYIFTVIFFGYEKYMHMVGDIPIFNISSFIKEKPNFDKNFLVKLTGTQMFEYFSQNSFINDKKSYFEEYKEEYQKLQSKEENAKNILSQLLEIYKKQYLNNFEINKTYLIEENIFKQLNLFDNSSLNLKNNELYKSYIVYFNGQGILKENRRIIDQPITLNNGNVPKNYIIFRIPEEINSKILIENSSSNNKGLKTILEKGKKPENIGSSSYINNNKSQLTEDDQEKIKEDVQKIMTDIYKGENKKLNYNKILGYININFGKDYIIDIIISGFKKDRVIKIIEENAFDTLIFIIMNCLIKIELDINDNNIEKAMKLLKFSLYHKTIKEKKEILLSDFIFPNLKNFLVIQIYQFWEKWIEYDMDEDDIKILKLIEESKNEKSYEKEKNYKLYITHSFNIINQLCSIMMKMKCLSDFILLYVTELGKKYIPDVDSLNKIKEELYAESQLYFRLLSKKKNK